MTPSIVGHLPGKPACAKPKPRFDAEAPSPYFRGRAGGWPVKTGINCSYLAVVTLAFGLLVLLRPAAGFGIHSHWVPPLHFAAVWQSSSTQLPPLGSPPTAETSRRNSPAGGTSSMLKEPTLQAGTGVVPAVGTMVEERDATTGSVADLPTRKATEGNNGSPTAPAATSQEVPVVPPPSATAPASSSQATTSLSAPPPVKASPNTPQATNNPKQENRPQNGPVSTGESVSLEPASFKGVTPGVTRLSELQAAWGVPREAAARGQDMVYLYSVAPFEHVEVVVRGERVEALVIRLNRVFPVQVVAEHLQLSSLVPVLVTNDRGKVVAQAYPERGVILAVASAPDGARPVLETSQIILQPLTADLFLLRAESRMWENPDASLRDLDIALQLASALPRAHWLRARLLAGRGDWPGAEAACIQAVQLDPLEPNYQLTLGEIFLRQGRLEEAARTLARADALAASRPHVRARIACIRAELMTRQSPPDYAQALEQYVAAIQLAEPLTSSESPAIRVAAKETILDAYLGAADCIAFGRWQQKEVALPHWWERAERVASDLVDNEGRPEEFRLHVISRVVAVSTVLKGLVDPSPYADRLLELSPRLVPESGDAQGALGPREVARRREMAQTLYDVAVVLQNRKEGEKAVAYAEKAAAYLLPVVRDSALAQPGDRFLLGKTYFRLGASYAVGKNDHTQAVEWFKKALEYLDEELQGQLPLADVGTCGEMLVSMGVSFWETGEQEFAYKLTQRGVQLIEKAVSGGEFPRGALAAPYANLGAMERHRGNSAVAERYLQQARDIRGAMQR